MHKIIYKITLRTQHIISMSSKMSKTLIVIMISINAVPRSVRYDHLSTLTFVGTLVIIQLIAEL